MSAINATPTKITPLAPRWRLWIDGCGGFLLLPGNSWSVGGQSHEMAADVCVRADWPRHAGTIDRVGRDFFWHGARSADQRILINAGQPIPVPGSAVVMLNQPNPLSDSALLTLNPPHRFDQHVDGVVLMTETLLVGPGPDCHLRCRDSTDRAILTLRDNQWWVKAGLAGEFQELSPGRRRMVRSLAMTLEEA